MADGGEHDSVHRRAVGAHGKIVLAVENPLQPFLGQRHRQDAIGFLAVVKIIFVVAGKIFDFLSQHIDIGNIRRPAAVPGCVNEMRYFLRGMPQDPRPHQVGRQHVGRGHQHVAAVHPAVEAGPALVRVDAVDQCQHGRQFVRQARNPGMQVPAGLHAVAALAGGDVDQPLEVLDAQADHGLVVGLHHGQIDDEIACEGIHVEAQLKSVSEVHRPEGALEDIQALHPKLTLQCPIAQSFEGMRRCFQVPGTHGDHSLADGNVVDTALF